MKSDNVKADPMCARESLAFVLPLRRRRLRQAIGGRADSLFPGGRSAGWEYQDLVRRRRACCCLPIGSGETDRFRESLGLASTAPSPRSHLLTNFSLLVYTVTDAVLPSHLGVLDPRLPFRHPSTLPRLRPSPTTSPPPPPALLWLADHHPP